MIDEPQAERAPHLFSVSAYGTGGSVCSIMSKDVATTFTTIIGKDEGGTLVAARVTFEFDAKSVV